MTNTNRLTNRPSASDLAASTADAYSFNTYGARQWAACALMLVCRGYNAVEVDAILRSKLMRLAADSRTGRKAMLSDLNRFLDSLGADLQGHVDDYVLGVQTEDDAPVVPIVARSLRLVWSR